MNVFDPESIRRHNSMRMLLAGVLIFVVCAVLASWRIIEYGKSREYFGPEKYSSGGWLHPESRVTTQQKDLIYIPRTPNFNLINLSLDTFEIRMNINESESIMVEKEKFTSNTKYIITNRDGISEIINKSRFSDYINGTEVDAIEIELEIEGSKIDDIKEVHLIEAYINQVIVIP